MKNIAMAIATLVLFVAKANAQQTHAIYHKPVLLAGTVNITANSLQHLNIQTTDSISLYNTTNIIINALTPQSNENAEKTKVYSKTFEVDKNDKVNLLNKFGSITIKTWDKKEVKIEAEIKAYANTEAEAQQLIDGVEAMAAKEGDVVSYSTSMASTNGSRGRGSNNGKSWRKEVKINLTVYMPENNALTASQQYGNIQMDDFSGPTSIKVQYGNFTANHLKSNNNYINIQYGKGEIKTATQAKIFHQYGGGLTLGTIGEIDLLAQYINVNIGEIKQPSTIKQQYGNSISIGSAGPLNINLQYCNLNLSALQGNLSAKAQYGKVTIEEVKADCKTIDINADYTSTNLSFAPNYNATFDLKTNYGSFKYGNNVSAKTFGNEEKHYSAKSYTGTIGKGGGATIVIKSNYGGITFK